MYGNREQRTATMGLRKFAQDIEAINSCFLHNFLWRLVSLPAGTKAKYFLLQLHIFSYLYLDNKFWLVSRQKKVKQHSNKTR